MRKNVSYLNWRNYYNSENIYAIGEDLILLDRQLSSSPKHPFKVDVLTAIVCLKGKAEGSVNLEKIHTSAGCFNLILPGQILTHDSQSDDFEAIYIIMSNNFLDQLGLKDKFPIFNTWNMPLQTQLSKYDMQGMLVFYNLLKWNINNTDNEYVLETAKHMTIAFFYGFSHRFQRKFITKNNSRAQQLSEQFMALLKENFKEQHSLDFYADKLCVTPKYLTTAIKSTTNTTAKEWINKYLILEAKALLKSTNLTIQQISDTLHFPSQDMFGKYFKHYCGISPKEYRNNS